MVFSGGGSCSKKEEKEKEGKKETRKKKKRERRRKEGRKEGKKKQVWGVAVERAKLQPPLLGA
jgi:hypothetical protein